MFARITRHIVLLSLLCAGALSFAQTIKYPICVSTNDSTTPNLGLTKPGHCSLTWDVKYNHDLDILDAAIASLGTGGGTGTGTGICSLVLGDASSITCGTGDRVGDTAPVPANVIVVGNNGLLNNNSDQVVAIGSTPVTNDNVPDAGGLGSGDVVAIGNNPLDVDISQGPLGSLNDIIAIGDNPLYLVSGALQQIVSIGNMNGSYDGEVLDAVYIGDQNGYGLGYESGPLVAIGYNNLVAVDPTNNGYCEAEAVVSIGSQNQYGCQGESYNEIVSIGDSNASSQDIGATVGGTRWGNVIGIGFASVLQYNGYTTGRFQDVIGIGDATAAAAAASDWVAIGDTSGAVLHGPNEAVATSDLVAIGDTDGIVPGGSSEVTAIGQRSVDPWGEAPVNAITEVVAIGDANAALLDGTNDVVAIGDNNIYGSYLHVLTTGANLVAIGDWNLVADTTGHDNIAIGDYAGSPGATAHTDGFATTSGSEQILLGDTVGQCSATQLDEIIVFGDHACAATSNSVVLGSATTIFDTYLYGTIHLSGDLDMEGTGTTVISFTPGLYSTVPTCTSEQAGGEAEVTDPSQTDTWGAAVTGTGTAGAITARIHCDGVTWTLAAK